MSGEVNLMCSRELALKIGAVEVLSAHQFRAIRASGAIVVRDPETLQPLLWPIIPGSQLLTARSTR